MAQALWPREMSGIERRNARWLQVGEAQSVLRIFASTLCRSESDVAAVNCRRSFLRFW